MTPRRLALAFTPGLLVTALWLGLGVLPSRASADDLGERLDAAETEIALLTAQLTRSSELGGNIDQLSAQLALLDAAVPADPDVDGFVRLADRVAASSGVTVDQVSPRLAEVGFGGVATVQSTSIDLLVEGSYAQLMSFLTGLTSAERIVTIEQLDLQSALGGDATLTATLTVRIFSTTATDAAPQPVESAATAADGAGATLEARE